MFHYWFDFGHFFTDNLAALDLLSSLTLVQFRKKK